MPIETTPVRVSNRLLQRIDAVKPEFLSAAAYLQLLATQALDSPRIMGGALGGPPSSSVVNKEEEERACALPVEIQQKPVKASKPKDPWSFKKLDPSLVPDDLAHVRDLIVDWWWVRKGTRSTRAWNAHAKKLRAWDTETQAKALTAAYMGQWADLWEPKPDQPAQGKYAKPEPDMKHPAHKVFTAKDMNWPSPGPMGGSF